MKALRLVVPGGIPSDDTRGVKMIAAVTVAAVLVAAVLTGCASHGATPLRSSSSTVAVGDRDPAAVMLALAPTLPGATRASAFPEPVLREPARQPVCRPVDVATAYWTSHWTGAAVVSYLMTHPGPHFRVSGSGTATDPGGATSSSVMLDPVGGSAGSPSARLSPPVLIYTIAPLATGVGIRADAEVVPADATCTRS